MADDAPDPEETLHQLSLLQVAKDLFLSRWFAESSERLFTPDERRLVERIAEESRGELRETQEVVDLWVTALREGAEGEGTGVVAQATRRDFLHTLIDSKEASWEVYQLAAQAAPPQLKERFRRLGDIDLRHADMLRSLMSSSTAAEGRRDEALEHSH